MASKSRQTVNFPIYDDGPSVIELPDMGLPDDNMYAIRAQAGDREAFAEIVSRYQRGIYSFVHFYLRESGAAEDITQETFLRAWKGIRTFRADMRMSTWLYKIAKNLCCDEIRRRIGLREEPAYEVTQLSEQTDGETAEDLMISRQSADRVRAAVGRLPDRYRAAVILFYFNELPYGEISEILGVSMQNTKILLFRAKGMLRNLLRNEEPAEAREAERTKAVSCRTEACAEAV